ncbi:hypothetical protein RBH26_12920 [Natronolimnohabitans sp. A-GB9]|uniref:hypothetical protein n=1 Tax=Natronolimnohabitans sp. A-GB9 TaxID=3069757 RepID=UPI0027B5457B|nr:hypothetical protein [Natronolimnohabitans sp. A-GB9]MDQ2051378.1 hypothetical protein [Natronolimnohabitans sp. A-GB9]
MSTFDLDAFVERSQALVDSSLPTTIRETRAWLVDPFLETLGWDVHAESCLTDRTVDDTALEYVCTIDDVPALFVAVERYGDSLTKDRAIALLETMAWTGVDRAIYTDGRDVLLLAGTTDVDRLACRLPELPDHESAISHYTRETIGQQLARHARPFVARQLAIERERLLEAIVTELTAATGGGDAYRTEFESAADRFLERLVASFAAEREQSTMELEAAPEADVSIEFSETTVSDDDRRSRRDRNTERPEPGTPDSTVTESENENADTRRSPDDETATSTDVDSDDPTRSSESPADADETDGETDNGEYVVRFFNDRGSIGAIGHSTSSRALVGAAEYLFERGLSGVRVPWHPDDTDTRAVLNESPTHPDGTSMTAPHQLSNGLYLETAGDVETRADRLEALAARAGLRAMLTGDWEST